MAGIDNLRTPSTEEARKIGRKGGIASGEARRKRKTIKEQMELLLSLPLQDPKTKEQLEKMGIDTENMDNQMAMLAAQLQTALKGGMAGVSAFEKIQASVGEAPVTKQEITGNIPVVIEDDIKE